MNTSDSLDRRTLLEHTTWLRALARSLVLDPNLADDLTQDTFVVALEHPPRDGSNPRAWLSTVLRNLLRQRHRGESRRSARERDRSSMDSVPAADEVLLRASATQELAQAVMDLEEPFRATILMRFFDDLPPRKIAAQLNVPVATVHSRLQRGFRRLRERLDAEHGGDRRAWVALLPVGSTSASAGWVEVLRSGFLASSLSSKGTLATVALIAVALFVWALDSPAPKGPAAPPAQTSIAQVERAEDGPYALPSQVEGGGRREAATTKSATGNAAAPTVPLRGVVLSPRATPTGEVPLVFTPGGVEQEGEWTGSSDASGRFEFLVPEVSGRVGAVGPDWSNLMVGHFEPGSTLEPVVVVAPRIRLAGIVVDQGGRPVQDAAVHQVPPQGHFRAFGVVLDSSRAARVLATTDEEGRFELEGAFALADAELVTEHEAYLIDRRTAPLQGSTAVRIELRVPADDDQELRGVVRDPDGSAVPAAWVALGAEFRRTDEAGGFSFEREATAALRRPCSRTPRDGYEAL